MNTKIVPNIMMQNLENKSQEQGEFTINTDLQENVIFEKKYKISTEANKLTSQTNKNSVMEKELNQFKLEKIGTFNSDKLQQALEKTLNVTKVTQRSKKSKQSKQSLRVSSQS